MSSAAFQQQQISLSTEKKHGWYWQSKCEKSQTRWLTYSIYFALLSLHLFDGLLKDVFFSFTFKDVRAGMWFDTFITFFTWILSAVDRIAVSICIVFTCIQRSILESWRSSKLINQESRFPILNYCPRTYVCTCLCCCVGLPPQQFGPQMSYGEVTDRCPMYRMFAQALSW